MFAKIRKSIAIAAALVALPMAAHAVTVVNTSDTFGSIMILDENNVAVSTSAPTLSLGPNGAYGITGFAFDGNGAGQGTGFTATQVFVNNTGQTMVLGSTVQLPATGFTNAFAQVTVGATTTILNAGGVTFTVGAGENFTLTWGADDVTTSPSLFNVRVAAVPLPAGALLLLTGLAGLAVARRRRAAA